MLNTHSDFILEKLIASVEERIESLTKTVVYGAAENYEEYKQHVGGLNELRNVLTRIEELEKVYNA